MAKHGSAKLYLFLIGCALVSVETPTAIAQGVLRRLQDRPLAAFFQRVNDELHNKQT
jgi:hypothetical protein